jgi:hypothetical protein
MANFIATRSSTARLRGRVVSSPARTVKDATVACPNLIELESAVRIMKNMQNKRHALR